ncbi:anaerobic sulfatase maturase [Acidaminobacter sp. JC074]|uniref:anaerobic sulfatase maturase n=1 Tax=Acidaminobacter sp. JC074 TaxID=2530199 RepID=UPI001F1177FF|nr:anaerobic sulfatase maturase [Acidaminobacter sp. JC074]
MSEISLLIKPSSDKCNISCDYCFYHDVSKHRLDCHDFMSLDVLEKTIQRTFEYADQTVSIAFQGGEPTLVGLDFYKEFIGYLDSYNAKNLPVNLSIQTNGILLDDEWCEFLHEENFLVGISLDGIKELHNLHRKDCLGKDTHHKVMEAIRTLKRHQVEFNVLKVITKDTLPFVKENYQFLKENQIKYLQLIPVLDQIYQSFGQNDYSLSEDDYGKYLCDLFDLWYVDFIKGRAVSVIYFENLINKIMGNQNISCGMNGRCTIQMVVEASGHIYPCDFYVTDRWQLGNVFNDSMLDILKSKPSHEFVKESFNHASCCQSCKWQAICEGGCKRHRQFGEYHLTRNYFCESYKTFYSYVYPRMLDIAIKLS